MSAEDWFEDALMNDEFRESEDDDDGECCPICGDDIGLSCPCLR